MKKLAALIALASGASADFISTTFYLGSAKCSGPVFQTVAQLTGCAAQDNGASLTVTCINATAAEAAVYTTSDCTGPSTTIAVPFDSSCSSDAQLSRRTLCAAGPYGAPLKGLFSTPVIRCTATC